MAIPVLLMGRSGSGKSTSMRNFARDELCLVNVLNKPLPFKGQFRSVVAADDYGQIKLALENTARPSIVIDDAGYLITNHFMAHHSSAGKGSKVFDLYNELGDRFWNLLEYIKELAANKIVYIVMHEDTDDFGNIKPKTIGNLLDKQVCIEGLFTIVLRSLYKDGSYWFKTCTSGNDTAKAPMGMFEQELIQNDLKAVDKIIRTYYGMEKQKEDAV